MEITEYDFQNKITLLLIDLLSDPDFLLTDPDAIAAVEKIRDVGLLTSYIAVSVSCFANVLKSKTCICKKLLIL